MTPTEYDVAAAFLWGMVSACLVMLPVFFWQEVRMRNAEGERRLALRAWERSVDRRAHVEEALDSTPNEPKVE